MTTLSTSRKAALISACCSRVNACMASRSTDVGLLAAVASDCAETALRVGDDAGLLIWFVFMNRCGDGGLLFDDKPVLDALALINLMIDFYEWPQPAPPKLGVVA